MNIEISSLELDKAIKKELNKLKSEIFTLRKKNNELTQLIIENKAIVEKAKRIVQTIKDCGDWLDEEEALDRFRGL